jgi:hypothetical protein
VVSALAYNENVPMPMTSLALHRLQAMPMEAPAPKDIAEQPYFHLGPVLRDVPIFGFKSWKLKFGSVLCSWWRDELWENAVKSAVCSDPLPPEIRWESHVPHGKPHDCGLYASHDLDPAIGEDVVGAVLGRGHLIIHEKAWRTQQMELIALCPRLSGDPKQVEAADALGAILNLPVMSTVQLEDYARHFGQKVFKGLAQSAVEQQAKTIKAIWEVI